MADQRGVGVRLYVAGGTEVRREFGQTADAGKRMWSEIANGQRLANPALRGLSTGVSEVKGQIAGVAAEAGTAGRALAAMGPVGIGAAAALGGLALALGQAREGMKFADEIGDSAEKIGIGTDALQEYRYAISQAGGEAQDADAAIAAFTRNLGAAMSELSPKALRPFKALGLDKDDLQSFKSADAALNEVAKRIAALSSEAERAAVADKLGLTPMLPLIRKGADEMDGLRAAAHQLGYVMDADVIARMGEANDKFEAAAVVVRNQFASAFVDLVPVLVQVMQAIADLARQTTSFFDSFKQAEARQTQSIVDRRRHLMSEMMRLRMGDDHFEPAERTLYNRYEAEYNALGGELDRRKANAPAGPAIGAVRLAPSGKGGSKRSSATKTDTRNAQGLVEGYHTYVSQDGLADVIPAKIDLDVDLKPTLDETWKPTLEQMGENIHDALLGGIEALQRGGLGGFLDWLKQALMRSAAEGLADGLTGAFMKGRDANSSGGAAGLFSSIVSAIFGGKTPARHAAGGIENFTAGEMGLELAAIGRTGQIFSHEDTVRALQAAAGSQGGVTLHLNYSPTFDARGAGPREVDELRAQAARDRAGLPGVIVQTVNDALERRQIAIRS